MVAAVSTGRDDGGDGSAAPSGASTVPTGSGATEPTDSDATEAEADTASTAVEPPATAGVRRGTDAASIWLADAEGELEEEWANVDCASRDRVEQVPLDGAQGSRAYRFEIRDGDDPGGFGERCEVGQSNPPRDGFPEFQEGDERWMAWQVLLPEDYPVDTPDWNVITQWKQRGGLGTPVLSMEVRDGQFTLLRAESSDGSTEDTLTMGSWPAEQGRWVRFTIHMRFSPDESDGFVELFGDLDGRGMKPLLAREATYTMKRDDGEVVPSHVRMGIYRDKDIEGTAHLYLDGVNVATTRAAAESAAFPSGAGDP